NNNENNHFFKSMQNYHKMLGKIADCMHDDLLQFQTTDEKTQQRQEHDNHFENEHKSPPERYVPVQLARVTPISNPNTKRLSHSKIQSHHNEHNILPKRLFDSNKKQETTPTNIDGDGNKHANTNANINSDAEADAKISELERQLNDAHIQIQNYQAALSHINSYVQCLENDRVNNTNNK
ncbi:hypothetical protein RFI_08337, partial [Reticulomyxa filosa]